MHGFIYGCTHIKHKQTKIAQCLHFLAVHVWHVVLGHQTGEDGHHHLGLDFDNVLGKGIDPSPDPPSHRQSVLSVCQILLETLEKKCQSAFEFEV
jgi:hypothetical protein